MVQLTVKLGPKGQVLIPKLLRDEYKLFPGKEVVIKETPEGVLITKPAVEDPIAVFERIARAHGKKNFVYDKREFYKQTEKCVKATKP